MNDDRNRAYWSSNLDAQNLGKPSRFRTELMFSRPPDWEWACAEIWKGPANESGPLLDLGAGLGIQSLLAARAGWTVVAADLAISRLAALRGNVSDTPESNRIHPVCCRAEALPFRKDCLGGFCARSVLIHTELPRALAELSRTLQPAAAIAIAEPLTGNPLVNLYRRHLGPKEWKGITRYFEASGSTERQVDRALGPLETRRWYGLGFLAFVFQFAVPVPWLWRFSLWVLMPMDAGLRVGFPAFANQRAWFVCLRGRFWDGGGPSSGCAADYTG